MKLFIWLDVYRRAECNIKATLVDSEGDSEIVRDNYCAWDGCPAKALEVAEHIKNTICAVHELVEADLTFSIGRHRAMIRGESSGKQEKVPRMRDYIFIYTLRRPTMWEKLLAHLDHI